MSNTPTPNILPLHHRAGAWTIGTGVSLLLFIWFVGWRKDSRALKRMDEMATEGNPLLIVVWHGKYFPLLSMLRGRDIAIVTNASFRGHIIGRVCRFFGYSPINIPVSGKANKLEYIKQAIKDGTRMVAIVPDGPLGPRHIVKSGAIRLAANAGFDILPLSVASTPTIVLDKRWDKHEIPRPFARVTIEVGERFEIPRDISGGVQAELKKAVAEILLATDDKADATLKAR